LQTPDSTTERSMHREANAPDIGQGQSATNGRESTSADTGDELDGLDIDSFAKLKGLEPSEVWGMLRRGELVGRTERGMIRVYSKPPAELPEPPRAAATAGDLPPVPWPGSTQPSQEMTLLLDHLSIAKEENREILKLTQDSIARIATMTDTIVAMKDLLLKTKDDQLGHMQELMSLKNQDIRKLQQTNVDLETMVRTLSAELATRDRKGASSRK
jgi:hypothetical protein